LNLLADYGGGGMLLAFGVVAGLLEASRSGRGQVVDAAMVDGAALLGAVFHGQRQTGMWHDRREANRLDGGAPFYGTYETADGRFVAVGANEPQFYRVLVDALGLSLDELPPQLDQASWPDVRKRFAAVFRTRTRDEWATLFAPLETCVTPVLTLDEALHDASAVARDAFVPVDGLLQAAPAPRFGRTPGAVSGPAARPGEHTAEALRAWGFAADEIIELAARQAIVERT
jgi:alpha-methylacyl-CoA racemase